MGTSIRAHANGDFAALYHWLYSDRVLTGEPFYEQHRDLFESLSDGAEILDCACGIGLQTIALARHGHNVTGTDASEAMIVQAGKRAADAGLDIPLVQCAWADLPRKFDREFDLAICRGSSVAHCVTGEEMIQSLQGIHSVLKKGGLLVLHSRNWERLYEKHPQSTVFGTRTRDGIRCTPMYVWNFPSKWLAPVVAEIVFLFEKDKRTPYRSFAVNYYPFAYQNLIERLGAAGFARFETDYEENADGYSVKAFKA